jgi:hypothetical protein
MVSRLLEVDTMSIDAKLEVDTMSIDAKLEVRLLVMKFLVVLFFAVVMSDGLFWAAKLVDGKIVFYRDLAATPGAAIYREAGIPYKYLKIQDGSVQVMDANEIAAVDAAEAQAQADANAAQAAQDAAQQAAEAAAAQAQEQAYLLAVEKVTPLADQYRSLLRKYFGEGAETNHEVTQESVFLYFNEFVKESTITEQQMADALTLRELFDILAPLATEQATGTANTWSADFWRLIQ